jgi:hypothetical protein
MYEINAFLESAILFPFLCTAWVFNAVDRCLDMLRGDVIHLRYCIIYCKMPLISSKSGRRPSALIDTRKNCKR